MNKILATLLVTLPFLTHAAREYNINITNNLSGALKGDLIIAHTANKLCFDDSSSFNTKTILPGQSFSLTVKDSNNWSGSCNNSRKFIEWSITDPSGNRSIMDLDSYKDNNNAWANFVGIGPYINNYTATCDGKNCKYPKTAIAGNNINVSINGYTTTPQQNQPLDFQ